MSEERIMKLNIDATGAEAGAAAFKRAISSIGASAKEVNVTGIANIKALRAAVAEFRPPSADAVARMADFKKAINNLSGPSNQTISGINGLKLALAGFSAPSSISVTNLTSFSRVIGRMSVPTGLGTRLAAVSSALSTFKVPSAASTANMVSFSAALGNMRLPANIVSIVAGLDRITVSANQAALAMRSIQGVSLAGVAPRSYAGGSGGTRRGTQGYGPRTNANQYDGIFSGEHRAVGEMRGFENVVNPSFQAASIARVAVAGGALTAGEGLKGLFEEGQNLIKHQHTLEIVTTDANDAVKSHQKLAEAMQFTSDIAVKYGLNITSVRDNFSKFAVAANAAGFTLDTSKKIFGDMSVAMRAMGADTETQQRIYRALDQIMQTGHVSMLQLHKEIGLQMPAIQIMAKALGITVGQVEELTRKGQLGSDSLIKFAAAAKDMYAAGLPTSINSPVASLERLRTEWVLTMDKMLNAGLFEEMGKQFVRLSDILKKETTQEFFIRMANALGAALGLVVDAVDFLATHIDAATLAFKGLFLVASMQAIDGLVGAVGRLGGGLLNISTRLPNITAGFKAMNGAAVAANAVGAGASVAGTVGAGVAAGAAAGAGAAVGVGASTAANGAVGGLGASALALRNSAIAAYAAGAAYRAAGAALLGFVTSPVTLAVAALATLGIGLYKTRDHMISMNGQMATTGDIWSLWVSKALIGLESVVKATGNATGNVLVRAFDAVGVQLQKSQGLFGTIGELLTHAEAVGIAGFTNMAVAGRKAVGIQGEYTHSTRVLAEAIAEVNMASRADAYKTIVSGHNRREDKEYGDNEYNPQGLTEQEINRRSETFAKLEAHIDPVRKAEEAWSTEMKTISDYAQTGQLSFDSLAESISSAGEKFLKAVGLISPMEAALNRISDAARSADSAVSHMNVDPAKAALMVAGVTLAQAPNAHPFDSHITQLRNEAEISAGDPKKTGMARAEASLIKELITKGDFAHLTSPTVISGGNRNDGFERKPSTNPADYKLTPEAKSQFETEYSRAHPKVDHTEKHDADEYTRLKDQFSGQDKAFDTYLKAVNEVNKARSQGRGNEAEYARILEGSKTKLMEVAGATNSVHQAQKALNGVREHEAAILEAVAKGHLDSASAQVMISAMQQEKTRLQELIDPYRTLVKKLNEEHDAMQLGNLERERSIALMRMDAQIKKETGKELTPTQKAELDSKLKRNQKDAYDDKQKNSGLQNFVDSVGTLSNEFGKIEEKIANDLPKAFSNFVKTGKLDWKSFTSMILDDLATMFAKQAEKGLFQALGLTGESGTTSPNGASPTGVGGLFGAGGLVGKAFGGIGDYLFGKSGTGPEGDGKNEYTAPIGPTPDGSPLPSALNAGSKGLFGGLFSSVASSIGKGISGITGLGAMSSGGLFGGGGMTDSISRFFSTLFAAEGGYTSGPGQAAVKEMSPRMFNSSTPHYAEGTDNTSGGMPAIVHPNEAIIPLSRGRKIPVDLGSSSGANGGTRNNMVIHVHAEDPEAFHMAIPQIESRMASVLNRSAIRNGG